MTTWVEVQATLVQFSELYSYDEYGQHLIGDNFTPIANTLQPYELTYDDTALPGLNWVSGPMGGFQSWYRGNELELSTYPDNGFDATCTLTATDYWFEGQIVATTNQKPTGYTATGRYGAL
jgi:hypothetical protein